jgi:indolepyruvate ferredoxin oxidoreductase
MEVQAAHLLYNLADGERPRIVGKRDEAGRTLLPSDVVLEPLEIARVLGERLRALGTADASLEARLTLLQARVDEARTRRGGSTARVPYFCSGCPHNTSTKVPQGSIAFGGIGCHTMAISMNRSTLPPTQMGGEGLTWTGIAPFTNLPHAFQNLGDGTYFHSGLLAIRAAVVAGVNLTYKILVNDAVAMTGGQPVEGQLSVAEITHQLRAERVERIAVVSDDTAKYGAAPGFAAGVTVHDRAGLEGVQRTLREVKGVSAIIYDQVCAAEKRRRRKRGRMPDPSRRVLINALVCEGCGDCSVQSNCVSVEPLETEFGRKRVIDQSSCNKDYSCVQGFCPAFVTVEGAKLRKPEAASFDVEAFEGLAEPVPAAARDGVNVLITGIGGTGVVTVGAVLGMAAHLEGKRASVFDMTGLAQKGGAVLSHLKISERHESIAAARVGMLEADLVLGCDLVVTASPEVLRAIDPGRTRLAVNTHLVPTARFQLDPDVDFRAHECLAELEVVAGAGKAAPIDASRAALTLLGDTLGTNMLMVGFALQKGWLPVRRDSVERALELNGTAVPFNKRALALGRLAAQEPERFARLLAAAGGRGTPTGPATPDAPVASREAFLVEYQNAAYAARFRALVDRVAAVEQERTPGRSALAEAVARFYFKLLAYKDEYEVARLHAGAAFRAQLASTFSGGYRLKFHLAPPGLARRDPASGEPLKSEFGGWLLPLFALLARFRFLRGTRFDVFGYSAERRLERRLIGDYERLVAELLTGLDADRHALAVELARIPEQIRGFGHVKARHLAAARAHEAELLAKWRGSGPEPVGGRAVNYPQQPVRESAEARGA